MTFIESRLTDTEGKFIRQSVIVYQEDLGAFVREMQKSLDYIQMHAKKDTGRAIRGREKRNPQEEE